MNILLVRPEGIGDVILCLPVATALRRLIPDAKITILSSEYSAPVLVRHPDLDDVLTVSGRESLADLVRVFRRDFDAAMFLKPFRRLMLAAWLARVPQRVATGYRWYSLFANRRVYEHRRDFSKHESRYNLGLLRGLGMDPGPVEPPRLVVTDAERATAMDRLAGVPVPLVVVHPGGFTSRQWKLEHYWNLARKLAEKRFGVVLTGNTAERRRWLEAVPEATHLGPGMLDLMGELDLRQLMAVIACSGAVVSASTGPAHLAAALGVPTVSLFDPRRNMSPTRWAPLGHGTVLVPDVPTCERCVFEACPYWDCLDRISVEHVVIHVHEVLSRPKPVTVLQV